MKFCECIGIPLVLALCFLLLELSSKLREKYEPVHRGNHRDESSPYSYFKTDPKYSSITTGVGKPKILPLTSCCGSTYDDDCKILLNDGNGCCTTTSTYDCDYSSEDVGLLESCQC